MSARRLHVRPEVWPLARPFTISRGTKTAAHVVVAEIETDGLVGRGECVPYPRYGETVDGVVQALTEVAGAVNAGLDRDRLATALPPGAARNALDCALWDVDAKASGRRVWDLVGCPAPQPTVTAETIGLDTSEAMAAAAAALADHPLLKIKVSRDDVVARVRAVRDAAPAASLVVDANEGWDGPLLRAVADDLAALGVAMIEQPLPAGADRDLEGFASPVPLCADESCHSIADLAEVRHRYGMVNVKLDKAGGLTAALALADAARAAGLQVMVGCMVATSLAMAPALVLTPGATVVDLDGPLWLTEDRAPGLHFADGRVGPPDAALWG